MRQVASNVRQPSFGLQLVANAPRNYPLSLYAPTEGCGKVSTCALNSTTVRVRVRSLVQLQDRGLNIGDEACRDLLASSSKSGDIGFEEFWEIVQSLQDVPFFRKQEVGVSSVGRRG